ncbi:MAG: hypothetical protein H0X03_05350 [Nitrosopumilus sp.]|nr:hypothetical protein [Nitrosopumilus sp.]
MSDWDKDTVEEGKKIDEEVSITPIQTFILTYLFYEEILETQQKEINVSIRDHPENHFPENHNHIFISLKDITLLIPSSLLPDMRINEEYIYNQLKILEYNNLLDVSLDNLQERDNTSFFITIDGIILVKQIFSTLLDKIEDKKVFEEEIDRIEGNKEVKDWLKDLHSKLKDKSKDEIADMVIEGIKIHGLVGIVLLINLLSPPTT